MSTVRFVMSKFLKGILGVFILSLTLFVVLATVQSCQKSDLYSENSSEEINEALKLFKNDLTKVVNKFRIKHKKSLSGTQGSLSTIDWEEDVDGNIIGQSIIQNSYSSALNLIKAYGITESEIVGEFGSLDSGKIVLSAEAILQSEHIIDQGYKLTIFENDDFKYTSIATFFINSSYAQSDTFGGCLADAIGITAAFEVIEHGIAGLGKKGVLKLIRQVGGKYLGFVGMGLAIYDFAVCMEWL